MCFVNTSFRNKFNFYFDNGIKKWHHLSGEILQISFRLAPWAKQWSFALLYY